MADYLVKLSHVAFAYGNRPPIFSDLNLELETNLKAGLIGGNGSGKSTLLQIITGLIKPKAGEIGLFGKIRRTEADFREGRLQIGFVFQDSNDQLFCPTVGDDLAFGPLNLGKSRAEADQIALETLALLRLEGFRDRATYGLSDGEKKLVAIGSALAMRPKFLILDEPTNCLDDETRDRVIEILLACGLPYLIVAHDKNFLEKVARQRFRLKNGQIEALT
ncbi:MAG: energy-coupling factor ABC transporter ATP-binding protein [Deltaproteobacteria bacterium]|nr:energy-coupling factor ABC transporter ATP-binding protein [Deltaproteobacteria bacterium]